MEDELHQGLLQVPHKRLFAYYTHYIHSDHVYEARLKSCENAIRAYVQKVYVLDAFSYHVGVTRCRNVLDCECFA